MHTVSQEAGRLRSASSVTSGANTAIFISHASKPPNDEAVNAIRNRIRFVAPYVGEMRVRVLTSPSRLAVPIAGEIAQALRVGRIERVALLACGSEPEAAVREILRLDGEPAKERAEGIVVVADEMLTTVIPLIWKRLRLGGPLAGPEETKLRPYEARLVAPGRDIFFPPRRRRLWSAQRARQSF